MLSDCAMSSVINLRKHPVSLLKGFSNQNFAKKLVSVVRLREVSVLERVQAETSYTCSQQAPDFLSTLEWCLLWRVSA